MRGICDWRPTSRRQVRRAFTLIEILAVVAIIGVLLTVIMIASVRALAGAREQQTRTTIKKIDEMLSRRTAAFERAITGRSLAGGESTDSELLTKYDNVPDSPMKKKWLFLKFFGTTFGEPYSSVAVNPIPLVDRWRVADLWGLDDSTPYGVPHTGSELAQLTAEGKFDATKHNRETESSEMLYWVLMNGPTFGADVVEEFNSSEVADTDGDGLMEFIDAWGKPLRFYRWPTRVLRPGPPSDPTAQGSPYYALGPATGGKLNNDAPATFLIGSLPSYNTTPDESLVGPDPTILPTTPLGHDTDDAYGEVFLDYMRRTSETDPLIEAQNFESTYHTLNTWHAPLVVSAGPDGDFGMYGPHEGWYGRLGQPKANATGDAYATALQDNVTNLNGQASGTGGQ